MDSKFAKNLSLIILVVGIISSIIVAALYGKHSEIDSYSLEITMVRSVPTTIGIFVGGMVSTCILSLIFYYIGVIVDYLEDLYSRSMANDKDNQKKEDLQKQSGFSNGRTSILDQDRTNEDGWECKSCGTRNPQSSITCKDCGTYK